jgi:NAD(P)-dependent dehydrogenase (short-subunit alcohol dehydrogenase family)
MALTAGELAILRPLEGRVACITGASGGIGAATAKMFGLAGAKVALMSRTASELEQLAHSICAAGGEAVAMPCDVCNVNDVRKVFDSFECLDILVNNAGGNTPAAFVDVTEADLDRLLGLNVRAAFMVAQAATRRMLLQPVERRMQGGSSIVHISSQMGRVGSPKRSVYCMTKHAVEGLNKAMAVELAPQGIRVNAVAPTFLRTPMTTPFFADDPDFTDWVLSRIPLGRLGSVDEVARTILFLASPAASLITGESLAVDGGWTAQ